MGFETFSKKQLAVLGWWCPGSPWRDRDAIILDGAVRSGKTLCLSLSFALWSMASFDGHSFALCGKTVTSLRRNLLQPLLEVLEDAGLRCEYKVSQSLLLLTWRGRVNRYYLFGGRDESSAALIQGVTLAGVLLDEVALMPRSFVEQALARCSVPGSRFWFCCNPEHPGHWFYKEWIQGAGDKNALHLHFTMEDNPSLTPQVRERYRRLYDGVFHERYVLGRWTPAHGAVYPMFDAARHVVRVCPPCDRYVISCDYGTINPASFGLWGHSGGVWYRVREYYHDSQREGEQRTDEDYAAALARLAGELPVELVVVDPSAASFIACLGRQGRFRVLPARNQVLNGIRLVAGALSEGRLRFHQSCTDILREFQLYRWDLSAAGDQPRKEHDHAMDDLRYFVATVLHREEAPFAATAALRGQ